MSRLINSTTMTVDALTEGSDWFAPAGDHDSAGREQLAGAAGVVLGRKTYEGLAAYWTPQSGPWADLLNPLPKFVASRTLEGPLDWNAILIEGDAAEGVAGLKEELDGDLIMYGCGELARHLIANGVVDELRFWLAPTVWGAGPRPYEGEKFKLRLLGSTSYDSGVVLLRYEPVR
jgi:dihydrofolate reductase